MTSGTCYRFVANCNRELWPLCLDWQTTECSDYDEYRCHYGGQCIPRAFKRDNHYSSDCLDGNDEKEHYSQYTRTYNIQCKMISTFSCEERISRLTRSFQCGNSVHLSETILPNYSFYCDNQRDKEISRMLLPSFEHISEVNCRQAFYCVLHYKRNYGFDSPWLATDMSLIVFEGIWNKECEPLTKHCSSEWLVIPEKPIMFRMFQFVYLTNRFFSEFEGNIVPDFVCYEEKKCPGLSSDVVIIELISGLLCFHSSNLTLIDHATTHPIFIVISLQDVFHMIVLVTVS
ncbi:unnamed protein product [Rotaria magnacalcarata]